METFHAAFRFLFHVYRSARDEKIYLRLFRSLIQEGITDCSNIFVLVEKLDLLAVFDNLLHHSN